jgi:hypothetical protein
MIQRKDSQSKSGVSDKDRVAFALQQYNDTEGHFSLVRWGYDQQPLPPFFIADKGPEIFDWPIS